uniref:Uncharacterized protein n=1 Tax=Gopherus evgoodei TaxID=1825980 RepID=A0A8C4W6P9_9SAUR
RPKGTPPPRHLLLTPPSLHTTTPAPKGDTTTAAPHGDTTTPAPAGDTTTPMPQRDTTTPLLSTATLAPSRRIIRFSLSFRIMNRSFRSSLLDPFSTYYQELELTIHIMIVCSRLRKNRGKLDLLSSQTLYEPRSEYPNYHTYGRFSTPDKK